MSIQILLYFGAAFVAVWGIAHLFPTKNILTGIKLKFPPLELSPARLTTYSILILPGILI